MSDAETQNAPILIVDDDPDIVRMLRTVLGREHSVLTASDGSEAFALLQQHELSAVLADHMMPGLTGVDLLNKSCELQPRAARLLITASDRAHVVKDAVNLAHVHRFVTKPVRIAELPGTVASAIHEAHLETENARLVAELSERNEQLQQVVSMLQQHRERLEAEVETRTSELRRAVSDLERLALRDGLTGLFNHRYFQEVLDAELARAARHRHPVSLLFLDVDHFKSYNDRHGHPAGDRLLLALANLLAGRGERAGTRRGSDISARYGGEEFVLLLPETNKAGARVVAERLRASIATHGFEHAATQPLGCVSASIGVATFPEDGTTRGELVEAADRELYRAKRDGRNRVSVADGGTDPRAFEGFVSSVPPR